MDKKRATGKPYLVYMTAGTNKFLRIYYGRVKEYSASLDNAGLTTSILFSQFDRRLRGGLFVMPLFTFSWGLQFFLNLLTFLFADLLKRYPTPSGQSEYKKAVLIWLDFFRSLLINAMRLLSSKSYSSVHTPAYKVVF